jgi:nanoRNase/pAp phosphatase (c-di-AMP/oligoRNAs hydrolase)
MKPTVKTRSRLAKLAEILKGKNRLLIVMQDNPDPDSIAAAVALRKLANTIDNVQCTITHGGSVGRAENRALVRYLGLNLRPWAEIESERFDCIAIVDAQPGTGNICLPAELVPDIVIDHHPLRPATRAARFIDIRSKYGATATILLEYLVQARIEPEIPLATALFYGIRSDTQDLGRKVSRADIEAVDMLYPIVNKRMLGEIQKGEVPPDYFQMLYEALRNARIYDLPLRLSTQVEAAGQAIVTSLGAIDNPDMIAEVADLLLREEKTYWTMCICFSQGKLFISVRTSMEDARADKVIHRVVARKGTGGGHQTYAGGQIPLKKGTKSECESLEKLVQRRFLKTIGSDAQHWQKLISD